MANCNKCGSSTPQPCCQDCAPVDPCNMGCLDTIFTSCVEHPSILSGLGVAANSKLDVILSAVDSKFTDLSGGGDKFVRISAVDTVSGYLSDKIKTCDFLSKTTIIEGGQQKLSLCLNTSKVISSDEFNPIYFNLDGINLNYTLLVQTIASNPVLLQVLCDAINNCSPTV